MWKERIDTALTNISNEILCTPLEHSGLLSKLTGADIYLKLENYQISGSFKLRGVMNKLAHLDTSEIKKGLVACSTGNHGAAFAYAVDKFGYEGLLYLPHNVAEAKLEALKQYQVTLDFHGNDCVQTEHHARQVAEKHEKPLVHPYNDPEIVVGQGTIAAEIMDQIPQPPDVVIVPVGGGGLIAGIASYMKETAPDMEVLGCQPENSAVMHRSLKEGRVVEEESLPTLSDATAGGVETDSITFKMCQDHVDEIVLITEEEISDAMRLLVEKHQMIVEGAAAMTLATVLKNPDRFSGKRVVLILSGKKVSASQLMDCLAQKV